MASAAAAAAPLPSQKELEEMLIQSGIELLSTPPSSTAELLSLLEKLESELKSIGQDPSVSTRNVLEPIKKVLIEGKLLRYSDKINEVSVASCICEIMRISAPVLPYDNTEMEVVFHQIIASLEKLHYVDSNCYSKALRVLEAVAKYKLCVRLLDFDYVLAVNVFQLFLKIISVNHTDAVLRDMVDIMSQLIEERDEVSLDFQVSILDSLRKRTLATAPCSTLLGKEVLEKCHARLKPCLLQLMTDMNMNLDDYCNVLGSVLHGVPEGENMVENVGSVPPVEGTSALQLPQVPLLDATPTMNNNSNLEPGTWSSLDINATSVVLALPAVTGKQSIPDVLAPSSTKTNINHVSPCKRGQPRKNQTDLTVRRRSERIRSAERQISPRKQSIPDVLAPNSTKTNINYGSPCKRGLPRKNQTDLTVRRRSERIRSAERKSKEKVIYTDDDVEILNLRR
ncbi:uncharacterized protein LOC116031601 [Ipomoea triloba]|uniref:uncharacterized protein LOC116031601 n=1 Tax=Ipomoea triloba TaxID=35885 RepID=UPI00125E0ACA|nr:uncharacterized protein LOC116031601 [Ipomoea triloba]XP_031129699.1 uncharacterized protein LOC116031601 [Ipomoea triloba]XP_031129700.1 uncharacterized protein LOC116031601 [Ipomoea triloba]XP_031129701.1 uncharacterized protein LOC116031601 [Ipomoea triloba]